MTTTIDDIPNPPTFHTAHIMLTPTDIKRATLSSSPRSQYSLILAGALFSLFFGMELEHAGVHQLLAYGGAFILIFCILGYIHLVIAPQRAVRQTVAWEMDLTLTEEEVLVVWPGGAYRIPWGELRRFRETKDDIFFVSHIQKTAFALPKRGLSSELLDTFRSHIFLHHPTAKTTW